MTSGGRAHPAAPRPTCRVARLGACAAAVLALAACGRKETPAPDRAAAAPAVAPPPQEATGRASATADTPGAARAGCPMHGDWQACSVEERIFRAGLDVKRGSEPVRHDFMSVPGILYTTSRSEIEVFLYPDARARGRDTDALDSASVSPRGRRVVWKEPATLVTSNNLAAIIITLNDREAERIALALGAGLPAPPRR